MTELDDNKKRTGAKLTFFTITIPPFPSSFILNNSFFEH